jgi:hypothetical protein
VLGVLLQHQAHHLVDAAQHPHHQRLIPWRRIQL